VKAKIEGSIVDVCDKCVKFGSRVVEQPTYKPIVRKIDFEELKENEFVLASGYGKKIRYARETRGLTREEFANRINEKESVIKRIEDEEMEPDEELTKRIEKFLGIKLTERYEERIKQKDEKKRPKLTVGDVVKVS
jgi:putative transcription factor